MPVINFQVPAGFIMGNPNDAANYVNGQADLNALQTLLSQPGVYIWGVKDENGKFCPLYVGIRIDIWNRINQHYNGNAFIGASTSGLFDLEQLFLNQPYFYITTLANFNTFWINVPRNIVNMEVMLNAPINLKDSFVYFQSSRAMNRHCNLNDVAFPIHDFTHQGAITEYNNLNAIGLGCLGGLACRMRRTKKIIEDNFYFIYAPFNGPNGIIQSILNNDPHPLTGLAQEYANNGVYNIGNANGPGRDIAERVEKATKTALDKINLFTVAKATNPIFHFDIDLTAIQNDLVNVGGFVGVPNKYPNNYGNAGNPPLSIHVP